MDLKSGPFTDKYVCHSHQFHVSEEIKVSFFKRLKFLSAETFLHLYSVSAIKLKLSGTFVFLQNSFGRQQINSLLQKYFVLSRNSSAKICIAERD